MNDNQKEIKQNEEAIKQIEDAVLLSLRQKGIESTLVDVGTSLFISEATNHEFMCKQLTILKLLVDKGIFTEVEYTKELENQYKLLEQHIDSSFQELVKQTKQEENNVS